jgi:thymidylate synthase
MTQGIPVLTARGQGIAEAWENSLVELHRAGCRMKTMYDKPTDPASIDATMLIVIEAPLAEPMIHKDFPGGVEDLQEYVMEVVEGIKNHLVRDPNDPNDTRWEYTYNERLFAYVVPGLKDKVFDQIDMVARKLAETPYTRRAQAITWKVWEDNDCYDPACLQSVWCRLTEDAGKLWLNTNIRFRSNDAYKAAFMNMFALVQLQKLIAAKIADRLGRPVQLGRYVHLADSYHIYGSYFKEFEERFMLGLQRRSFEERTYRYADMREIMEEARPAIAKKVADMTATVNARKK